MERTKYCKDCGEAINANMEKCPKCSMIQDNSLAKKNYWLATILLCWFLGVFGGHRFYTGHTTIGIIQLLTGGGCGIWFIYDLIMIALGQFKDADGNLIENV